MARRGGGGDRKKSNIRWVNIGILWDAKDRDSKYEMSGKIEAVPTHPRWDGQIYLYPQDKRANGDFRIVAGIRLEDEEDSKGASRGRRSRRSRSDEDDEDDEEGDDFDSDPEDEPENEPEEPEEEPESKKARDRPRQRRKKKEELEETKDGPQQCSFCGEKVSKDTVYCPIGKDLMAEKTECHLGKYRCAEDVPEGKHPL